MIRKTAVAGYFYTDDQRELGRQIHDMTRVDGEPRAAIGVIAPHAGYKYSGHTAGLVYASTVLPKRFLVMGPKHHPGGARLAYQADGAWETPLGEYPIDEELVSQITTAIEPTPLQLEDDPQPHRAEHSIEVQIPFLKKLQPDGTFMPLALGHLMWHEVETLGKAIASALAGLPAEERPLIVASSDMNHYEDEDTTLAKDERALDQVRALDPKGLLDTCAQHAVSMCGVIPSAVMLVAAKELGATEADILEHTTSARASGDTAKVVGYAAVQVF